MQLTPKITEMETLKSIAIVLLSIGLVVSLVDDEVVSADEVETPPQREEIRIVASTSGEIVESVQVFEPVEVAEEPVVEAVDPVETLRERHYQARRQLRNAALSNRLGFTDVQIDAIEAINESADFTGLDREGVEDLLRLAYTSLNVLTPKQVEDYFAVMRDYERMRQEDYANEMTSEIRLLLGLDEDRLDLVYGLLYDMPEDTETALAAVLEESELQQLKEFYEQRN